MSEYRKAIFAALTAALGAAATALADGAVSPLDWVLIASAALAAGGAVYGIPNATPPEHRE